ncbi:hypothetical protein STEG23_013801 [Scotinomys teguina]
MTSDISPNVHWMDSIAADKAQRFSLLCKIPENIWEKSKAILEGHISLGFVAAFMTSVSHILERLNTWFPVGGAIWNSLKSGGVSASAAASRFFVFSSSCCCFFKIGFHYVALTVVELIFVDQAGLELTEIHLPLPSECLN